MRSYTLGFIFDDQLNNVLLVHKLRPDWQKGFLNGIGGKIEPGEESVTCISRETAEESGLEIAETEWIYIGNLNGSEWTMDVYTSRYKGDLNDAKTIEDEKIEWFNVNDLPPRIINNLNWLIPFAIDKLSNQDSLGTLSVKYL